MTGGGSLGVPAETTLTLGIETSCDDTGVALIRGERTVVAERLSSQIRDHARFGGVVPEFAARKHLENLLPLVDSVLRTARGWAISVTITFMPQRTSL